MSQVPAQEGPTFKLVLVGDGGTGKVFKLVNNCWSNLNINDKFKLLIFIKIKIIKVKPLLSSVT